MTNNYNLIYTLWAMNQEKQLPKCHIGNTIGVILQSAIKRPIPATFNTNFYMCDGGKYCMKRKLL